MRQDSSVLTVGDPEAVLAEGDGGRAVSDGEGVDNRPRARPSRTTVPSASLVTQTEPAPTAIPAGLGLTGIADFLPVARSIRDTVLSMVFSTQTAPRRLRRPGARCPRRSSGRSGGLRADLDERTPAAIRHPNRLAVVGNTSRTFSDTRTDSVVRVSESTRESVPSASLVTQRKPPLGCDRGSRVPTVNWASMPDPSASIAPIAYGSSYRYRARGADDGESRCACQQRCAGGREDRRSSFRQPASSCHGSIRERG